MLLLCYLLLVKNQESSNRKNTKKKQPQKGCNGELASYGVSPLEIRVMAVTTDQLRLKDATDTADSHVYLLCVEQKVIA